MCTFNRAKERRREKEEREGGRKRKEERERELAARFAAVVGHARAATFGRSATRTRNKKKMNTMTGIEFGCRNSGLSEKDFGKSGAWTGKNLE